MTIPVSAYIVRAATVKGWPPAVIADLAGRAEAAGSDRDALSALAAEIAAMPYRDAAKVANIPAAAAGAGRYRETAATLALGAAEGIAEDAAAVARGARTVAGASAEGFSRVARSPGLAIAAVAAVAALVFAVRR
jgi:hypothetical protein